MKLSGSHVLRFGLLGLVGCGSPVPADSGSTTALESTGSSSATAGTSSTGDPASSTTAAASEATGQGSTTAPVPDFPPDEGPPCDPYAPYSCPEGQKCVWDPATGNGDKDEIVCVPLVRTPTKAGEPCTLEPGEEPGGMDECEIGTLCGWFGSLDHSNMCTPLCKGSVEFPACDPGWMCITSRTLAFCRMCCDPLLQDCAEGEVCRLEWYGGSTCDFLWEAPEAKPGTPCQYGSDCALGAICAAAEHVPGCAADSCCTELCRLGGEELCQLPGQSCRPMVFDGEPPCIADLGMCTVLEVGP